MRLLLPLLVLCACTTGIFAGDVAIVPSTASVVGPEQAVLRLDEVIQNSKLYLARMEQLKKDQGIIENELKQMGEQISSLKSKLEVLSPTNEKYAQTDEDLQFLKIKSENRYKQGRAYLDRNRSALLKECFTVLRGHLATFAKERHIKLVLMAPNPELPNVGTNELLMQLGMQSALYFDPSFDITEPFIAYANGRFAAAAPTPSTTGAPTPTTVPAPVVAPARP